MSLKIPCMVIRGGTSKGVFLNAADLPADPAARDRVILAIFGSPDARQINGLGGADPLTSKVAIIEKSDREDSDVNYLFGQVGIDKPEVGYMNNCGNLSSAVGLYAVESGLLEGTEPEMTVRIYNVNSGKRILATFKVENGTVVTEGDYRIDGVPGTGAPIRLSFCDPTGAVTGALLPTGNPIDRISIGGQAIEVSIVDCGNLYTFVPAADLGFNGNETPSEIESKAGLAETMDTLRNEIADRLISIGAVSEAKGKALRTALKVAIVAEGASAGSGDEAVRSPDLVSRILNPGKVHKSYAVTGAVAMAGASAVKDSVVGRLLSPATDAGSCSIRIGHPQGAIDAEVSFEADGDSINITSATIFRTARCLMEGVVHVPDVLDEALVEE